MEREPAGIGLAKLEAAAKTVGLVRDHGLKRVEIMLLTESQESGEDTNELHCGCCGEGLAAEGKASGLDSRVERMESDGGIAERCPVLNICVSTDIETLLGRAAGKEAHPLPEKERHAAYIKGGWLPQACPDALRFPTALTLSEKGSYPTPLGRVSHVDQRSKPAQRFKS